MFRFEVLTGLCILSTLCLAADDGSARTLQYDFQRSSDAQYQFSFETSNGIKREETGEEIPSIHDANNNAALVKGSYSYPGPDGVIYTVNYVADEAGFHPEGDHLKIPPFTPWVPGQPVDEGHYKADISGQYKPDESGKFIPGDGEDVASPVLKPQQVQQNYISGERILSPYRTTTEAPISSTQKYLPSQEPPKPNYISGESILDTFLTAKTLPPPSKYLPSSTSSPQTYTSGESILDAFRESARPSPKYLPFSTTTKTQNSFTTENPLNNAIIKSAFFNKPTPHPDILLHSTPIDRLSRLPGLNLPRPFEAASQDSPTYVRLPIQSKGGARATRFSRGLNVPRPFEAANQDSLTYVNLPMQSQEGTRATRFSRGLKYTDINPEFRILASVIRNK